MSGWEVSMLDPAEKCLAVPTLTEAALYDTRKQFFHSVPTSPVIPSVRFCQALITRSL